eukprot:UN4609
MPPTKLRAGLGNGSSSRKDTDVDCARSSKYLVGNETTHVYSPHLASDCHRSAMLVVAQAAATDVTRILRPTCMMPQAGHARCWWGRAKERQPCESSILAITARATLRV